jgi:hypothetical protein
MELNNIIKLLSVKFSFDYNKAVEYINTQNFDTKLKDKSNKNTIEFDFELPYYGVIFPERCKAIIFNRGLLTQCKEITKEKVCKKCVDLKYGLIYERQKYEIGKFVSKSGKAEKPYIEYLKKNNISAEMVEEKLGIENCVNFVLERESKVIKKCVSCIDID